MQVLQNHSFKKTVKKLHANQKQDLDQAVRVIMKTPTIGQAKTGDLSGVFCL